MSDGEKRRVRCRFCAGLNTKRKGRTQTGPEGLRGARSGLQRFWCHDCERTFTLPRTGSAARARFSDDLVSEVVTAYVEGLGSYRMLARSFSRRLGQDLSARTINRWVTETGARALTPLEMSARLAPPGWGGWVGIDGKQIRVGRGDTASVMIAVDHPSSDLVHALVVPHESGETAAHMLIDLVRIGYPLQGVVADLGSGPPHMGFPTVCRHYFGNLPFQACRIHFLRRAGYYLSTPHHRDHAHTHRSLLGHFQTILFAPSYPAACDAYYQLTLTEHHYHTRPAQGLLRSFRRTFGLHMTHHHHPGLPPDANTTENVVRALTRKIGPMEHFATPTTANHYLRLLTANYRWKPFTDSTTGRNGQSPLQHAGATLPTSHWLSYLKQAH